ncbi:uncharacterized protein LOC131981650 [Centropristis striata]|uniref:uncharacterized protein LOC131981650 n=1 Tax=Centropristis striata TaxID=184440 RepID=UPI0027E10CD4|nr:uncharacterized protein LOC131981650 [Centropristis striata]
MVRKETTITLDLLPVDESGLSSTPSSVGSCLADESEVDISLAEDCASSSSQDTIILPASCRSAPWPVPFVIPKFSRDIELILAESNKTYHTSGTHFHDPSVKSAIMQDLAKTIFSYSAYPSSLQINSVAAALVEKFPCLKEPGSFAGMYGWQKRLKYKMHNYRAKLRSRKYAYPEIEVNTLKRKKPTDAAPAKNVKRPKKAEVNYLPPHPVGENEDSLDKERLDLINEIKKNNAKVIGENMSKTFSFRRVEVVTLSPAVRAFKERWPGLFTEAQIKEEFRRITTVSLEETFMLKLDEYTPRLLQLMRAKGGAAATRMQPLLNTVNEFLSIENRRDVVVSCLIEYLGEQKEDLFQDCQEDIAEDHTDQTMKVLVIHNPIAEVDPADVSIVIEGDKVLNGCGNRTKACMLLMGLIYALNLEYPKSLKYTFEVFQKLFWSLMEQSC